VLGDDGPLALLEVAWQRDADQIPPSALALVALLSADAAAAIVRAARSAEERTDAVTGLPNREDWNEALERELTRAERLKYPVCVVIADLDGSVPATGPHANSDQLLAELADNWQRSLRSIDVLARIGGEAFALILPGCVSTEAMEIAERLHHHMPDSLTASIGIADWNLQESVADLLSRADVALGTAKKHRTQTVIAASSAD